MENIKTYGEFCNEEINLKKALIGGVLAVGVGLGTYDYVKNYGKARLTDTEIVGGGEFKQYSLYAAAMVFDLNISSDGIISSHWTTQEDSGTEDEEGNAEMETVDHNCITLPNDRITEFWYDSKISDGIFSSIKPISGGNKIILSQLSVYYESDTYKIYSGKFLSPFDYVIVNKNHKEGEKVEIPTGRFNNNYLCDRLGPDIYIFVIGKSGRFGGGGANSEY